MKLHLQSGEVFEGTPFGADKEIKGEVVFATGMTGYLEMLTDPSYYGQILVFTFPLIGNYGAFEPANSQQPTANTQYPIDPTYESDRIWVKGVILAEHSEEYSHCQAYQSFKAWLQEQGIPALSGVDTRALTQVLREHGCIMGSISDQPLQDYTDPLKGRYVPEVSPKETTILEPTANSQSPIATIAFLDCGAKNGIFRHFLKRGVRVLRLPYDTDPFTLDESFDGIFCSNGPGDPETATETIEILKKTLAKDIPVFGICLGNQILALAAGASTTKMKYGHRGVNQPVKDLQTGRCLITSQNHGYMVDPDTLPPDYEVWFENLNDGTVEGIRHKTKPIFSVQFHPEACGGPEDAEYLFDAFVEEIGKK